MFIYSYWRELCKTISLNCKTIHARDILNTSDDKWVLVKHDVETNVFKALELAKIEKEYGIKATYYVQADLVEPNHECLQEIQKLGHEIAYHYDVMDANKGSFHLAKLDFCNNLETFRKYGFDIKTVCPHGNPAILRNGWNSNKDFFRNDHISKYFPDILDIVVHLPSKLDSSYTYISDAGFGWKKIVNISDNDISNKGDIHLKSNCELKKIICSDSRVILSTHPHRWYRNKFKFLLNVCFFKFIKTLARIMLKTPVLKKIVSKYYYLSRRI
ncbi:hypothetical protein LO80_08540 [Candidatus Francisella endociliophora]|uniref:Polysaccharide deacetylase n=1 Tax=Candidatus Francisella endociliophora TaxID=653937 RepID=A0A097ER04_9GAMM|nr:hypothetical protein [Francisella sp. FSC1006]AIT10013.1 hypothetical protein LO80_08540 [Francisella sp. FSC1006]